MDIKITKKEILQEMNNDMTTYKKYLVYFKLLDDTKKFSRKGHFIQVVYHDDLFEFADADRLTEKQQKEITNEILIDTIYSYCQNFEDTNDLYNFCNNTIKEYNNSIKKIAY